MFIVFLIFIAAIMVLSVMGLVDSRFQFLLNRTRLINHAKAVYGFLLALSLLLFVIAVWNHQSPDRFANISTSSDKIISNRVQGEYEHKGLQFKEQPASAPSTRCLRGSNADNSITLNIIEDTDNHTVRGYQLVVNRSCVSELKTLTEIVLPTWKAGSIWIDHNLNNNNLVSTSYEETLIEICANSSGPEKAVTSYYLGIYPHGYNNY